MGRRAVIRCRWAAIPAWREQGALFPADGRFPLGLSSAPLTTFVMSSPCPPSYPILPPDMRHQGRITTWNDDKGFGFITPNGGGERVFLHISEFSNRQRRPRGNELVTYECITDDKGR